MDFDEYDYLESTVEGVKDSRKKGEEGDHREEERSKRMRGHEERRDRDGRGRGDGSSSKRERDRSERDGRRHREPEKERSHSKSRDVDRPRDRERYRAKEPTDKDHRPSREKRDKKEQPMNEPEADPERDQRTVFAYQICLKADERDVYEFFSKAGKVRDVRLIMDRMTRRSKGVGYVEFYDAMSVPMAIAMSGQLLHGVPVMVKPSEAEKNLAQSTATGGAGGYVTPYSGGARRLYVGNLHFNITEDQLRQVFEPFGVVELVQLPTDPETGQCKGFGFVQYAKLEDARVAQQALNGVLQLAGRMIKVSSITEQFGMQDIGGAAGELDDDEGGGLSLTAQSRALLMQKLDRTGTVSNIAAAVTGPITNPNLGLLAPGGNGIRPLLTGPTLGPMGLPSAAGVLNAGLTTSTLNAAAVEPVGAPTDCLLLRNMFDPRTETEPDFDLDIKDDVLLECSKYGLVTHIFVDKNSAGHVYIRFESQTAAVQAQRALHGRWFAGKMISTSFLTPQTYETKFPESR